MYEVSEIELHKETFSSDNKREFEYRYILHLKNPNKYNGITIYDQYTYVDNYELDLDQVKNRDVKSYIIFDIYKDKQEDRLVGRFDDDYFYIGKGEVEKFLDYRLERMGN